MAQAQNLPPDASVNVDHYLYGHPKKMNRVFADTSYYIALMSEHDQHHARAVAHAAFYGETVTTDFVLAEVGNWLSRTADRPVFLRLLETLGADCKRR